MSTGRRIDYAEFVEEFEWTRTRHDGDTIAAAAVFGVTPVCLVRRLYRARQHGYRVQFTDRTKAYLNHRR